MGSRQQPFMGAFLLPVVILIGFTMPFWPGPSLLQLPALILFNTAEALSVLFLIALPVAVYYLVIGITRRQRQHLTQSFTYLVFCLLWLLAFLLSQRLRHDAFVRAASKGAEIVQALSRYRNDKGEYPEHLEQLVPQYLDRVPDTGMLGYPAFDYRKRHNDLRQIGRASCRESA